MWLLLALAALTLPVVLFLLGRRSEEETLRDWDMAIGPKATQHLDATRLHSEAHLALLDWTYDRALEAREMGQSGQARRLLELGCQLIEEYCPSWTRSLSAMSVLARMVTAIGPVAPLRSREFRTSELSQLAGLGEFLHYFLVSTSERFQLRIAILSRGFQALVRVVLRSRGPAPNPGWDAFDAMRSDVRTLSNESVETVRILFAALEAGPRR